MTKSSSPFSVRFLTVTAAVFARSFVGTAIVFATIFAAIAPASVSAQSTDYYRSPLDIPIHFSANFGEIRTNRFHTGIDIKTQGVTGKPLYATADGYIARVTVAPNGYGRALYIAHPNGTTTVYAHLDRFRRDIEDYLRAERYRQRRSDLDAFPEPSRFPVKKGDPIGVAGNSGSSTGPHLHYEVRRSATSETLNILANGWVVPAVRDNTPPRIVKLYHVDIDTVAGVPIHSKARAYDVKPGPDGNYSLVRTSPLRAGRTSYFVVEATDRKDQVANTFGVYRVRMSVDGQERVVFEKDGVTFDNVRYACASVLYEVQRASRNEAVMLAVKRGNRLPMYKKAIDGGVIRLAADDSVVNSTVAGTGTEAEIGVRAGAGGVDGEGGEVGAERATIDEASQNEAPKNIEITVEDDAGNEVKLGFLVDPSPDPSHSRPARPEGRIASDRSGFSHIADGLGVSIPQGALYEPMFYTHTVIEQSVQPREDDIRPLSRIYRIGDGVMPLQKAMRYTIIATEIPESVRAKACLAKVSTAGALTYAGGTYKDGAVSGTTRDLGTFCIVADRAAPTVRVSFEEGANLSNSTGVTLTATDNFSGISHFTGTIDGEWMIFERAASRGQFVHRFDTERLETGRTHTLVFTVRDGVGNETVTRRTFFK